MGSSDKPKAPHSRDRSSSTHLLRVISETLGKPESVFFDRNTDPNDQAEVFELINIYKNPKFPSDRRYLMAVARSLRINK